MFFENISELFGGNLLLTFREIWRKSEKCENNVQNLADIG